MNEDFYYFTYLHYDTIKRGNVKIECDFIEGIHPLEEYKYDTDIIILTCEKISKKVYDSSKLIRKTIPLIER